MKTKKFILIVLLLIVISTIHHVIPREGLTYHVFFRMLYLLPIAYAALSGGRNVGFATSIVSTILFIPHFLVIAHDHQFYAGNIVAIVVFNLTGIGVGMYRDSVENAHASAQHQEYEVAKSRPINNILFYIDQSSLNSIAAQWLLDFLGVKNTTNINLLSVSTADVEGLFESHVDAEKHLDQKENELGSTLAETKKQLMTGGIPGDLIQINHLKSTKIVKTSQILLEQIQKGGYDLVLLGRHPISKAQEFLVGDIAVRLTRDSPVPVVVIKGSAVAEQGAA